MSDEEMKRGLLPIVLYFASTAAANIDGGVGNVLHKQAENGNEWRMAA